MGDLIPYDETYSYKVFDDGYDIYMHNVKYITQRVPYDKPMDPTKSWEENAILQLDSITAPVPEPTPDPLRADLDFMALMLDIDLPSDEKGE